MYFLSFWNVYVLEHWISTRIYTLCLNRSEILSSPSHVAVVLLLKYHILFS